MPVRRSAAIRERRRCDSRVQFNWLTGCLLEHRSRENRLRQNVAAASLLFAQKFYLRIEYAARARGRARKIYDFNVFFCVFFASLFRFVRSSGLLVFFRFVYSSCVLRVVCLRLCVEYIFVILLFVLMLLAA